MAILVIAEHDNTELKQSTRSTITAALQCGSEIDLLILGHQCPAVVKAAETVSGVSRVLLADSLSLANGLVENATAQILTIASNYTHILAPATAFGKGVLPRVAAKLDVGQISEITHVVSPDTFERPIYAGNAVLTVQSLDSIKVITVRPTAFLPALMEGAAQTENLTAVPDTQKTTFLSQSVDRTGRPELSSAKVVVAGGHGIGSAENFRLVQKLADKLGAAIGASRAAVDAGFVQNDLQIGQTGKIVAPQLYIALGISGAIQHVAGIKDAKVIVAINQDADAPIFLTADYGIVGDLHELVPQLIDHL